MITCDDKGTITVSGNEREIIAQFMTISESIRNDIVAKKFNSTFEINSEMLRIAKEVNRSARKRIGN